MRRGQTLPAMVSVKICILTPDVGLSEICSIKREIGHLCHDERRPKPSEKAPATGAAAVASTSATPAVVAQPVQTVVGTAGAYAPITVYPTPTASLEAFGWPANAAVGVGTGGFGSVYQPETFGNEFRVLT